MRDDLLEIYNRLCLEAAQECGAEADIAAIEKVVRRRLSALPQDQQDAVKDAVDEMLTSFTGPGFHEAGPH